MPLKDSSKRKVYQATLSEEAYEDLVREQDNKCAICTKPLDRFSRKPHVDHDHISGEVRGILCAVCNPKLGWFEDYFINIMNYLKEHHGN